VIFYQEENDPKNRIIRFDEDKMTGEQNGWQD
jgi:hypothetical protein